MCGRFTLKTPPLEWGQLLIPFLDDTAIASQWLPRYNIAPTQQIVALAAGGTESTNRSTDGIIAGGESQADSPAHATPGNDGLRLVSFRWGLVPGWASDLAIGSSMINARSESIHEKRSFKGPLVKRRCLIVADGYYEWQPAAKGEKKQPFWIHHPDESPFLMAGIWDVNLKATGAWVNSCSIITTAANDDVHDVHDRMPVILDNQLAERWLLPDQSIEQLLEYLSPAPKGTLSYRAVSTTVNNARHEGPSCLGGAT